MRLFQLIACTFFLSTYSLPSIAMEEAFNRDIPSPECIEALNGTACGYNCSISQDGREVACAEWPGGKCKADRKSVACGPPAPPYWYRDYQNQNNDPKRRERCSPLSMFRQY